VIWELLKYEIRKASTGCSKYNAMKNRKLYEDLEIELNEIAKLKKIGDG